ncbi:serine hydrolase domain-containing protein [Albidovulum sediminis]|uniref:Serine hydrolase n=1 Tax=Albidovulum sediminis TaxID=3066345 RepID=A0ABT2NH17_9RHOB|nr:serine hydrolase [Defluviimonas sediminis]MCT8328210.1 serine hydrolase [Defluviimonas sediminis]
MTGLPSIPNPDLTVGKDNKQGWNQPDRRREGFHNGHARWRRMLMIRARRILSLRDTPDPRLSAAVEATGLTRNPAFSALVVAEGDRVLHSSHAGDFGPDRPHSIQSVTKLHAHLILGELVASGRIDPDLPVVRYLPWIGSGYAAASVQDVLDMNVENDFTEDYDDPQSGCYAEEEALGWRLPPDGRAEITLRDFVAGLTGGDLVNRTGHALYKSANTDVLTLIAAAVGDQPPLARLQAIADAAGYEGGFHISLSPDLLPALSGGACLSARDLARFGLLLARRGGAVSGADVGDRMFLERSLHRPAPILGATRGWVRYSNQLMTDGKWVGHAGYGGQFLMADMETGRVAAFLSVLENDSGYDDAYMAHVIRSLEGVLSTR